MAIKTLTDQLGNIHSFAKTPKRIISLVPSQTELLFDLGLNENLIGITKFCVHPFQLKQIKTIVGGTKQVKFDKIKALNPDIIICNKEENTLEMVQELRKLCPVWITNIVTIEDNQKMIYDFGQIFDKRIEAQKWIHKINFAHQDFLQFIKNKEIKEVAYFIWANPYMVCGSDTFVNELLKLNNFDNIYQNKGRYPQVDIQEIKIEGDPDYIFLSSEPFPFKNEHAFEIGRHTHHASTVFVDGEMFSWYGSRLLKSFDYFKKLHEKLNTSFVN